VRGLARLKEKYVLATLSNGNVSLLAEMAKSAGLPWGCGAVGRAVPSLQAGSRGLSGRGGSSRMQAGRTAAHHADLQAARSCGLRTAFVPRPLEYGRRARRMRRQASRSTDAELAAKLA